MTEEKPLRADARRNRARVLEAAEAVFAAKGTSAPTEEVAKVAGVGVGTVFRHFPTKEALLEAVLVDRLHRFAEEAEAAAEADDPAATFYEFLTGWIEMSAAKNAYSDALAAAGVEVPKAGAVVGARLKAALALVLKRAQEAGAVREDMGVGELLPVVIGAARAAEHIGGDADLRARTVAIIFSGLQPRI
ncbi:TetR/AcrR family transcriptional regulator [Amycolatopsis sp. cg5]|uniref:TetR/AcrR family transcriptional regulator n=1 Tax=Amycolatopsis sp. cg5 TaxID=3238802 RepID=UPI0035261085